MDKKNVIYIIVVLLIFSVSGYYLYQHGVDYGLAKPALILKISTNLSEEDGAPMVNNITFEQSSVVFFYKRADSIPSFPEIEVNARINMLDTSPASFWASTPYKEEGVYELTLLFRDGNEPKPGDVLIIPLRIINIRGVPMYKTTSFYEWE